MTEKEILKQEELDFAKVFNRFFRAWPLIILSVLGMLFLAGVFILTFPPSYNVKASYLIDKPLGMGDPGTMMVRYPTLRPVDDYYYMNQKHALTAFPVVQETVERLGLDLTYIEKGLFDKDIYERSPIVVTLDDEFWNLPANERPTGTPFYIDVLEGGRFSLEAEGEYPITEEEFFFEGEYSFGDWIMLDQMRVKVDMVPDKFNDPLLTEWLDEGTFGFRVNNTHELSLALKDGLEAEPVESAATVIVLNLQQPTAKKAMDVLTTLSEVYVEQGIEEKVEVVDKALEFLRVELDYNVEEAARLNKGIEDLKVSNGFTGFQEYNLLTSKEVLEMEEQKVSLILKKRYYSYLLEELTIDDDYTDIVSPSAFGIKDQLLNRLTSELVDIVQERDAMLDAGTQANPAYQQILAKIDADQRSIVGTVRGFQESNMIALNNIDSRIAELDGDLKSIPKIQNVLMAKERMVRIHESLISNLRERISNTTLNKISITSDVQLLEEPYLTSLKPVFPDPVIIGVVALLLGLLLPIIFTLVKTLFSSTIDHEEDVLFSVPEGMRIGTLANSTLKNSADLISKPDSRLGQDISRTLFTIDHRFPGSTTIALTSFRDNEGKAYVSSAMAIHSAQRGLRTLLIDAHPGFNALEGLHNGQGRGLADVLKGDNSYETAKVSADVNGLDLLPSGALSNVLLESGGWTRLTEDVKKEYDRVFIVTTAFGSSASVYRLLENTDLNIIVARRSVTRFDDVEHIAASIDRGLIQRTAVLVTDTFDSDIDLSPWSIFRQSKSEKPMGIFSYVARLFKRV